MASRPLLILAVLVVTGVSLFRSPVIMGDYFFATMFESIDQINGNATTASGTAAAVAAATTTTTTTTIQSPLSDDAFCSSLQMAVTEGPRNIVNGTATRRRRNMIHTFVSNSGHFSFLHNVLLSMQRSSIPWKPLVLAMDDGVCHRLDQQPDIQQQYHCVTYLDRLLSQLGRDEPLSLKQIRSMQPKEQRSTTTNETVFQVVGKTFYGWGSVEHKFLINVKLYALRDLLTCGVDAFVTDTDVAFRYDPRIWLEVDGPRGDVLAQNDTTENYQLSLNSGFMYWRNTPANRQLAQDLIVEPPFWWVDQSRVNTWLHNRSTPHTLLDADRFPNGFMMDHHWNRIQTMVVAIHANYNSQYSEKQAMLAKAGLWYLPTSAKENLTQ